MSKIRVGLLLCFGCLVCLRSGFAQAERKWKSPDGKAFFFVPKNYRKQRLDTSDPRVGLWTSKDKETKLEFFVFEDQSESDLNRSKWEKLFLEEAEALVDQQLSYDNLGTKVWVTKAKSKDGNPKRRLWQAALVVNEDVYLLRSESTASFAMEFKKGKDAVYSLSKVKGSSTEGPRGLEGVTWEPEKRDFSIFIPDGLNKNQKMTDLTILAEWQSLSLGMDIRVGRRLAPHSNTSSGVQQLREEFRREFKEEFLGEMPDSKIVFEEFKRNGREVWAVRTESTIFGTKAEGVTWVFRVDESVYMLVVYHDPTNPEAVNAANAVLESLKISPIKEGKDTGDLIDQRTRPQDNAGNRIGKLTGRIGGICLLVLIVLWGWQRRR